MKNNFLFFIILPLMFFSSTAFKCGTDKTNSYNKHKTGSIDLFLATSDKTNRDATTAIPEVEMTVDHYYVDINGANGESITSEVGSDGFYYFTNLKL